LLDFKTYLIEGRDAPLYHATSVGNLNNMLEEKAMTAETMHRINGKNVKGTSLTRNFSYAMWFAGAASFKAGTDIIIELDQRKLTQNYKIVPVNYDYLNSYKKAPARNMSIPGKPYTGSEYEEFVIGTVRDINKYILKIHASSEILYAHTDSYGDHSSLIIKHPKLFIDRKFINA
jgi:hypothetical protein